MKLSSSLPVGRDEATTAKRNKMFEKWDLNSNGALSFTEVDSAMRIMIGEQMGGLLQNHAVMKWDKSWKPVIMRAYMHVKDTNKRWKAKNKRKDDYVEKDEFRLLLVCIRQYFEMFVAFSRIDLNDDRRIDLEEFKQALPTLKKWGIDVAEENAEAEFAVIDDNGGGYVLFDEFIHWALERNLDLDDDDDFEDFDMEEGEKLY